MIRRLVDMVCILSFIWTCMLFGLWMIDTLVVPLTLPIPGLIGAALTSTIKVLIGTMLVLLWLWLWREIAKRLFWHTVKKEPS